MMWDTIQTLVKGGSTVLLTTQYMEEADRLCDNIVVIDRGRKIAEGTADDLKTQIGGERIALVVASTTDIAAARSVLNDLAVDEVQVEEHTRTLTAGVSGGVEALESVLHRLSAQSIKVADIGLRRRYRFTRHQCQRHQIDGRGKLFVENLAAPLDAAAQ